MKRKREKLDRVAAARLNIRGENVKNARKGDIVGGICRTGNVGLLPAGGFIVKVYRIIARAGDRGDHNICYVLCGIYIISGGISPEYI